MLGTNFLYHTCTYKIDLFHGELCSVNPVCSRKYFGPMMINHKNFILLLGHLRDKAEKNI